MSKLSSVVWSIADQLRGPYHPHEYGSVILPMTILRRLDAILEPHREQIAGLIEGVDSEISQTSIVRRATGLRFFNTSKFTLATLLKDPDLLIFDEPTNGLDPAGIREIRQTMRGLADQGKTVLVSSHILAEVEQIADTVSIVTRGRLVASGRVSDLIGGGKSAVRVRVASADAAAATSALEADGLTVRAEQDALVVEGTSEPARVSRLLGERGVWLSELTPLGSDLESVFLGLTQHDVPGGTTHRGERRGSRGGAATDGAAAPVMVGAYDGGAHDGGAHDGGAHDGGASGGTGSDGGAM